MISLITSLLVMLNSNQMCLAPQPTEQGHGCCSWHGGVCGCDSYRNRAICCDGALSSCGC